MAVKFEKVRMVNPHKGKPMKRRNGRAAAKRCSSKKRGRTNPADLLALGYLNPHKGKKMRKHKTRHKAASPAKRRRNPFFKMKHKRSGGHHRRRRNPSNVLGGTGSILKQGFYALVGLVAARQLPQMILGAKNTGWMGYAANIAAAVAVSMLGSKMFGSEVGKAVLLGGGLYTVNRVLQDQMSPIGKVLSLSGVGDYNALSGIQSGYFPLPVPTTQSGMPIIPAEIRPMAPAPAPAPAGVSGINASTRYQSRF